MKLGVPWISKRKKSPKRSPSHDNAETASIHDRLDNLTRQFEQLSRNTAVKTPSPGRTTDTAAHAPPRRDVERYAGDRKLNRDPLRPVYSQTALDQAMAEIVARQRVLDRTQPPPQYRVPDVSEPAAAARSTPSPSQNLSGLEEQLRRITTQIESLRGPCPVEESVPALRQELSGISRALAEALPRRAIEAIETDVRGLAERLDQSRHSGSDAAALANIEQGLAEVRDALRTLRPAESLVGFQNAIQGLTQKIDGIVANRQDPMVLQQLESAITGLRGIVAHVASDDTLARLTEEVRGLAAQLERTAGAAGLPDKLTNIERRIGLIAEAIDQGRAQDRQAPARLEAAVHSLAEKIEKLQLNHGDTIAFGQLEDRIARLTNEVRGIAAQLDRTAGSVGLPDMLTNIERQIGLIAEAIDRGRAQDRQTPARLEAVVHSVAEKIEKLQPNHGDTIAFGQLEDRIAGLVEKLDASGSRFAQLEAIERGLADVLVHLEELGTRTGALRATGGDPAVESLKQDLEAVNGTLGRLIDRLTMLESGIRASSLKPAAAPTPAPTPAIAPAMAPAPAAADPIAEPGPAAAAAHVPPAPGPESAPALVTQIAPPSPKPPISANAPIPPATTWSPTPTTALSERLAAAAQSQRLAPPRERPPIDPNLPPDHPLEPGTAVTRTAPSPAERIAASEAALGAAKPVATSPEGKSNFIAAARRAAQQAASQLPAEPAEGGDAVEEGSPAGGGGGLAGRVRSMLVGASVIVLTLGVGRVATLLIEPYISSAPESMPSAKVPEILPVPKSAARILPNPTVTGSTGQSAGTLDAASNNLSPSNTGSGADIDAAPQPTQAGEPAQADITGAIPAKPAWLDEATAVPLPPTHSHGETPAEPKSHLAAAAAAGDPAAAYELAVRHIDGRGVRRSYEDAARWLALASKDGLAPAQFRLGSLYEKGMGVKKDLNAARRLYTAAAEKGNAKAMHNLAVLYAEGIDGKPDYKTAIKWFRKAADRGVADSQYNLGVLYARGVGLDQNLAESYKWFALAAKQGDQEAGRKRDDIGGRLDADSLMAARLATKTWTATPQPKEATTVAVPPGGWDSAPSTPSAKRRARDAAPRTLGPS